MNFVQWPRLNRLWHHPGQISPVNLCIYWLIYPPAPKYGSQLPKTTTQIWFDPLPQKTTNPCLSLNVMYCLSHHCYDITLTSLFDITLTHWPRCRTSLYAHIWQSLMPSILGPYLRFRHLNRDTSSHQTTYPWMPIDCHSS